MKLLFKSILVLALVFLAFYLGARVGAHKTWVHAKSVEAHSASNQIEFKIVKLESFDSAKDYDEYLDNNRYATIYEALRAYGRYLDHWSSNIPVLRSTDRNTLNWLREAAPVYLETKSSLQMSPEEAVRLTISEMIDSGELTEEEAEKMSSNLLPLAKKRRAQFERAIEKVRE